MGWPLVYHFVFGKKKNFFSFFFVLIKFFFFFLFCCKMINVTSSIGFHPTFFRENTFPLNRSCEAVFHISNANKRLQFKRQSKTFNTFSLVCFFLACRSHLYFAKKCSIFYRLNRLLYFVILFVCCMLFIDLQMAKRFATFSISFTHAHGNFCPLHCRLQT